MEEGILSESEMAKFEEIRMFNGKRGNTHALAEINTYHLRHEQAFIRKHDFQKV